MSETVKADMQKALTSLEIRVVMTGFRRAKIRLWIAVRLSALASFVMGGARIELA